MKKTILATMTVAAAILASASLAKANAYLELTSGVSTLGVAIGNNAAYIGTVGNWSFDFTSGQSSGSATVLTVGLNTEANGNSVDHGLTVVYSSGSYPIYGNWYFGESESGDTLGATAAVYRAGGLYPGSPASYGTQLGSILSLPADPNGSSSVHDGGTIGQPSYWINEVLNIGGGGAATFTPGYQVVNVTATFKVTQVPDGGLTIAMLGSVLIGVAGIRSKFGKRA